jgi:hypothetical protein
MGYSSGENYPAGTGMKLFFYPHAGTGNPTGKILRVRVRVATTRQVHTHCHLEPEPAQLRPKSQTTPISLFLSAFPLLPTLNQCSRNFSHDLHRNDESMGDTEHTMASSLLSAPWHPISPPLVLTSNPTNARGGTPYSSETVVTIHGDSGDNITFYAVATISRTRPRGQFGGLGLGRAHPWP